jgi:hypothetical protein
VVIVSEKKSLGGASNFFWRRKTDFCASFETVRLKHFSLDTFRIETYGLDFGRDIIQWVVRAANPRVRWVAGRHISRLCYRILRFLCWFDVALFIFDHFDTIREPSIALVEIQPF